MKSFAGVFGRVAFVGFCTAVGTFMLLCQLSCADEPTPSIANLQSNLGIVTDRPASGRCVEVPQGYMVPYTTSIPGTSIEYTMVPVPPGKLKVSGDATWFVEVPAFWIGKTEVTWAEYHEFMKLDDAFRRFAKLQLRKATEKNDIDAVTAPTALYEPTFAYEVGSKPNQPAVSMRQFAAKQYTKWLSLVSGQFLRLPSAAEWTYACQAGASSKYSFGDDAAKLREYAWYYDDSSDEYQTGEVATKRPNRWGIHDMHGNVAEWVLDGAGSKAQEIEDGQTLSTMQAIAWPTEEWNRLVMGGCIEDLAADCTGRSYRLSTLDWQSNDADAVRSPGWLSSYEGQQVGFRVMRPLAVPPRKTISRYWDPDVPKIKNDVAYQCNNYRTWFGPVDPSLPQAIKNLPPEE